MRFSPLFFAPPLADFSGQRGYSWKELSELATYPKGVASVKELVARQDLGPTPQHDLPAHTISLPLDHKGETNATFNNRFWLNATFYEPGGPVIFYDVGEWSGEYAALTYLNEYQAPSPVMRLASRYKGLAIAWEHRFYGESFPSNSSKTFSPEWKYHTIQQALDDVVVFANAFANTTSSSANSASPFETYAVHPSKTPWIGLSGSYPGARIAFLREKHPGVIFAGWGSSVCSRGQLLTPGYYSIIQSTLRANCSADWAAVRRYVDELLIDGSSDAQARLRLGGDDEIEALTLPAASFQGLGKEYSTDMFCDQYETLGGTREASPRGLVAELGIEAAYTAWADMIAPVFEQYKQIQSVSDELPDTVSWIYQICAEIGILQVHDNDNPNSFVSSLVTEDYLMERCRRKFASDLLPEKPRVNVLNDLGGWDINPSNFFFTDGEFDPWRILTPSWPKKEGTIRSATETRPKCNTRPPLDQYYGKVYPNTVHMPEYKGHISRTLALGPDEVARSDEILDTSLKLFQQALDEWLPCFSAESSAGHHGDGRPVGGASQSFGGAKARVAVLLPLIASLYVLL